MPAFAPDFVHVRASGLWDASASEWSAAVRYVTGLGDVCSFTETTLHEPKPPQGWHSWHGHETPGANEASILWDGRVWEVAGPGFSVPVSKTTFALGNGKPRPRIHLTGIPLRHRKTGRVVIFSEVHTPSAVEGKKGLVQGVRRSLAYRETLAGITAQRRALRKVYPGAAFVVGGDWNVNLRLPWARATLRAALPGLASSWRRLPVRGSHGNGRRVIDDTRHSSRVTTVGATLLLRPKGFDHTPVLTRFRFRRKAR